MTPPVADWTDDYLNGRASLMQFYEHASHGEKEKALSALQRTLDHLLAANTKFKTAPSDVRWK